MAWIAAAIAGGAALTGGLMSNQGSAKEAGKNRSFQEEMSNTSYQRGIQDMKAAGINPMLSAKVGGASTPTGAQAQVNDVLGPAANSAISAYNVKSNQDLAKQTVAAEIESKTASAQQARTQADLNVANTAKATVDTATGQLMQKSIEVNMDKTRKDMEHIDQQIKNLKSEDDRIAASADLLRQQFNNAQYDVDYKIALTAQAYASAKGIGVQTVLNALKEPGAKNEAAIATAKGAGNEALKDVGEIGATTYSTVKSGFLSFLNSVITGVADTVTRHRLARDFAPPAKR